MTEATHGGGVVSLLHADQDAADFDNFYQARYSGLVHSLYLVSGDWTRAEDAAQEAFVRAWQRWRQMHTDDPVAWVRTVGWRICIDDLRSRTRLRRALHRLRVDSSSAEPPDMGPALARLAPLPPQLRAVAVLHYVDDLSVEQIGAVLRIPTGTVKSRLSRARTSLRRTATQTEEMRTHDKP